MCFPYVYKGYQRVVVSCAAMHKSGPGTAISVCDLLRAFHSSPADHRFKHRVKYLAVIEFLVGCSLESIQHVSIMVVLRLCTPQCLPVHAADMPIVSHRLNLLLRSSPPSQVTHRRPLNRFCVRHKKFSSLHKKLALRLSNSSSNHHIACPR